MKQQKIITGCLIVAAAAGFWISWMLMPDPGTTDANHILTIVKASRAEVLSSVIVQIITSVLYVIGLFFLVKMSSARRKTMSGAILLGIGVMGLCADAFFHLLAWFMTDPSVTVQQDVIKVMGFMQGDGLFFLVPILLPFFIGSLVLAAGLHGQGMISRKSQSVLIATIIGGIACTMIANAVDYKGAALMQTILGLFAIGQALIGIELIKTAQQEDRTLSRVV